MRYNGVSREESMKRMRNLAVAATGLLSVALTCFAQVTTIEGIVKGQDGKPLEKAEIQIIRTDIKANYKTKTDKKGHYLYMGLPIGNYNVELYVDGKKVDQTNGVRTSLGDPKPVNFDLAQNAQLNAQKQAEMAKAAETGQISKELERGLSKEQKEAMEKQIKERAEQMKKRGELNAAFNAGMEAMTAKNFAEALTQFKKAAESDPTQIAVWQQIGEAGVQLAVGKTGAEFDAAIAEAMTGYQKTIELKPDDAGIRNNYALALVKARKLPEAQAELGKAAALDPTNAGKYYYNLGAVLVNANKTDEAAEAFKKSMEANYAEGYYQYGVMLVSKAQVDAATGKVTPAPGTIEAFQKYLEIAPTGTYAANAKEMLASLGGSVQTRFGEAKKAEPKKKK
jgi:tetratricopeptide (TPR) repeat protein